jgi:cyclopropane fatty-acyl-phospholipid synthase-like methyltransferase
MALPSEVEYWDQVAEKVVSADSILADNTWKRPHQLHRLLKYDWQGQKVLEIGVGNGIVAGALQISCQVHWDYIGTELSPKFRQFVMNAFHLETIEADVRELPDGPFTRIIALDSLEHVRPEHRERGYARMAAVAKKDCLLFIHLSHEKSYHNKEFDHPFGLEDLVNLEKVGFSLQSYERYICKHKNGPMSYAFVEMKRD